MKYFCRIAVVFGFIGLVGGLYNHNALVVIINIIALFINIGGSFE